MGFELHPNRNYDDNYNQVRFFGKSIKTKPDEFEQLENVWMRHFGNVVKIIKRYVKPEKEVKQCVYSLLFAIENGMRDDNAWIREQKWFLEIS